MVYEVLTRLIRKHFYVLSQERLKNVNSQAFLDRYVAKHPLLRPELIVVNDQPFGFKKISKRLSTLERYPVFVEIEYSDQEDGERFIECFDLYSETRVRTRERQSDLVQLASQYGKYVTLEKVKRFGEPQYQVFLVYSRLNELFLEEYFEHDLEEGLMQKEELEELVNSHMVAFVQFIKAIDDLLSKGKAIDSPFEHSSNDPYLV